MNIFHRVTLQSLKKNRTRTVVTIIGIILSAALICAVATSVASFLDYMKRSIIYNVGNWQGGVEDIDFETYSDIKNSGEVSETFFAQQIGYANIESKNKDKPYMYILGADKSFADTMSVHLIDGRLPSNGNEIILPGHLTNNAGLEYSIGDTLELEIGQRIRDGVILGQHNPYYAYDDEGNPTEESEELVIKETRTFTVVGFFQRPGFESWYAPGFTAITAPDKDNMESFQYDVYFNMERPKDIFKFMKENDIQGDTNSELLACIGVSRYDGFTNVLYGLAAIVTILIMFGSISLIYNAFSISVSERTKQFGLLSSVGATKKQLRRTVFFEAGVVSLIGIPLGILVGIVGIGTTLTLISDKFDTFGAPDEVKMKLCISVPAIIVACAVALVTVFISAWIPSKRATKISAVEAIRQSNDIKAGKRAIKTPKIIGKIFGLPGLLAHKYYKRSKKKYRATVVSLFMSIVLFIPSTAFTGYLVEMADSTFSSYGYDLTYSPDDLSGFKEDDILETLKNEENVDHAAYCCNNYSTASVDGKYLSDKMKKYFPSYDDNGLSICICFVNDDEFINLLEENKINADDYMNPDDPMAIAVDNMSFFDYEKEKSVIFNALSSDKCEAVFNIRKKIDGYYFEIDYYEENDGENIEYLVYRSKADPEDAIKLTTDEAYIKVNLKSAKTIHKPPFFVENHCAVMMIYPYSAKDTVVPENADTAEDYFHFRIQSKNHSDCYTAIKKLIDNKLLPPGEVVDYAEIAESDRNIVAIVRVFAYGFIVLISLIAAANVFNTISTNISLRRREFAMLKSIGMTGKGFNRMMNFECILYGIKSLIYGLPVSIAITYWIYKSVSEGFYTSFHLPWKAIVIAVSSVLIVVFATMMYSMRKIKKDNPIDALKNENI